MTQHNSIIGGVLREINKAQAVHAGQFFNLADIYRGQHVTLANKLAPPPLSELATLIHALKAPSKPAPKGAPLQTLIGLLLDESTSMKTGCKQTMEGYNKQLTLLREESKGIGCRVTQVIFSTETRLIAKDVLPNALVPLSVETYNPNGGTALYDATVALVKELLANPLVNDDNTSVLLSITTDGEDFNSVVWKTAQENKEFCELMRAVSENDRWTVTLAGPVCKLKQFAQEMSVSEDNVAAFIPENVASRMDAMASSCQAMSSYVSLRAMGGKKGEDLYAGTVAGASAKAVFDN